MMLWIGIPGSRCCRGQSREALGGLEWSGMVCGETGPPPGLEDWKGKNILGEDDNIGEDKEKWSRHLKNLIYSLNRKGTWLEYDLWC